jgi:hypothetical protein
MRSIVTGGAGLARTLQRLWHGTTTSSSTTSPPGRQGEYRAAAWAAILSGLFLGNIKDFCLIFQAKMQTRILTYAKEN